MATKRPTLNVADRMSSRAKKATVVNINGNRVDLWIHGSSNLIKNVEVVGGTPAEYLSPKQVVPIIWVDNRPVVVAADMSAYLKGITNQIIGASGSGTGVTSGRGIASNPPPIQVIEHVINEIMHGSQTIVNLERVFIERTTAVYVNGYRKELGVEYTEDLLTNSITFYEATPADSVIVIDYLTLGGPAAVGSPSASISPSLPDEFVFSMVLANPANPKCSIEEIGVSEGTVTVDWGDNSSDEYSDGYNANHWYDTSGTYEVKIYPASKITKLKLDGSYQDGPEEMHITIDASHPWPSTCAFLDLSYLPNLSWTVAPSNLPSALTRLRATSCPGIFWTLGVSNPVPSGFIEFWLDGDVTANNVDGTITAGVLPSSLQIFRTWDADVVWNVGSGNPLPPNLKTFDVYNSFGIVVDNDYWNINSLEYVNYLAGFSTPQIDAILEGFYNNKANYTHSTPELHLFGGGNHKPSGVYQFADPPTTGEEFSWNLQHGSTPPVGPQWNIWTEWRDI